MTTNAPVRAARGRRGTWRSGMVLVLVLIVVSMLTLAGYSFSELMFIEHKGARLAGRRLQVRAVVESAAEAVVSYLGLPRETKQEVGGHGDNPAFWQGVLVLDDSAGSGTGRFSVIAPQAPSEDQMPPKFGLADESGRLNLAALMAWETRQPGAGQYALLQLPGMTPEVADALLDWMDADQTPREAGAESEYYERLETPVQPANALPATIEELLLVRGVTRRLLFGDDLNRNGSLESSEQSSGRSTFSSLSTASPSGWVAYLTLHSGEANLDEQGQPRIDLNGADLKALHGALSSAFDRALADFVIHFRQYGPAPVTTKASGGTSSSPPVNLSLPGPFKIGSPWDLIGVSVSVPVQQQQVLLSSPLREDRDAMRQYLPQYLDRVTVTAAPILIGRVGVNSAPREVLLGVPGLDSATVDEIVAKRPLDITDDPLARHAAWLVLDEVFDLARMRALWPYLTGSGDVYRAQIVGYLDVAAPRERVEIVVAATSRPARLVSWIDLRTLGAGYTDDVLFSDPLTATSHR